MRYLMVTTICAMLLFVSGCKTMQSKEASSPPVVPKKIAVPVGKNWQVVEEPPVLTNERHEQTLPFQTGQSLQPPGAPPVSPSGQRTIETPR